MPILDCRGRSLDLSRAAIMGILNITPDSFSDGGAFLRPDQAIAHGLRMVEEGADVIDVGGESTRPGAHPVSAKDEIHRVVPVIEALHDQIRVPISIDTSKPEVMRAAIAAGAGLINDVRALREEGALATAAELGVPICLMHMLGEPRTMQTDPRYENVVSDIRDFLRRRIEAAVRGGVAREKIIVDPGFGFGKTVDHNLELLRNLQAFTELESPILVGLSRKAVIGKSLNLPVERRVYASVALALTAVRHGARIVRVHDVAATRDAVRMLEVVFPPERH